MTFLEKIEKAKTLIEEQLNKHPKHCISLSFGKDSVVLAHLALQVRPNIPMVGILSNTEFEDTYSYRDQLVKDWNINYIEHTFENDPEGDLNECCRDLKVETFKEALKNYDMWFSGIRLDEGFTRNDFKHIEERGGLVKVNPILDFTEKDIWRYIALNEIKVNPIYRKGYRSLSCKRCSAPEKNELETERAGRWVGTNSEGGECGIHTKSLRG